MIIRLRTILFATTLGAMAMSPAYAQDTIKIGIDASYKPNAWVAPDGELTGFEVDLTKAVCAEIKAKCDISNVPWDGIWTALDTNTIDMVGTTVTVSKTRLEKYDASRVIYKIGYAFLVPADADISGGIPALKGKSIGTITGTQPYYEYIKAMLGDDTDIRGYDSPDAAGLDLDAGRIAAFMNDDQQLQYQFISTGKYKLVDKPTYDSKFVGAGRAWFFRKGSKDLVDRFNKGLDAVIASGKLNEIGVKYLKTNFTTP
ncbi:transporter substrate-binding domain-containing protein [Mesorhizobium sp. M1312]|uniref:substrate-binding periplasmic protein n=1 Tax=unclassified Mesorhizobium TaxID=325217 RepID=UPI00333CF9F6